MRTEDKSSLSGHHLDSHLHFRVMYRYVMVATIITLAPLGRTFPHTVLIGMNNISSYKTPHDPRKSRVMGVCKRHLWESTWMAFKRSAVRSRLSPPKKVRFIVGFFFLCVRKMYEQHYFKPPLKLDEMFINRFVMRFLDSITFLKFCFKHSPPSPPSEFNPNT